MFFSLASNMLTGLILSYKHASGIVNDQLGQALMTLRLLGLNICDPDLHSETLSAMASRYPHLLRPGRDAVVINGSLSPARNCWGRASGVCFGAPLWFRRKSTKLGISVHAKSWFCRSTLTAVLTCFRGALEAHVRKCSGSCKCVVVPGHCLGPAPLLPLQFSIRRRPVRNQTISFAFCSESGETWSG